MSDGIQAANAGQKRMINQIIRFAPPKDEPNLFECEEMFNVNCITYSKDYDMKTKAESYLDAIAMMMDGAGVTVRLVIGDMIERNKLCNKIAVTGRFGCDQGLSTC